MDLINSVPMATVKEITIRQLLCGKTRYLVGRAIEDEYLY